MKPHIASSLVLLSGLASAGAADSSSHQHHPTFSTSFLNFSSPAPYIFSSLSGLLSNWANTFFSQGHAITACRIPAHTLLYHGRHDTDPPPSPEWLAFDVEMAYAIMGNLKDSRMLTYRTTREVRALYFDGVSADSVGIGAESQMVFLVGDSEKLRERPWPPKWGRPPPDDGDHHRGPPDGKRPPDSGRRGKQLDDDYFRARGLCKWIQEHGLGGKGWGYEGVVRMNSGFELIWCDFNSPSLKLVSNLNVSAPRIDMKHEKLWPGPPESNHQAFEMSNRADQIALLERRGPLAAQDDGEHEGAHGPHLADLSEPFRYASMWMWFNAGARHYGHTTVGPGRGEARIRADTCGFFTFYDPELETQSSALVQTELKSLNLSTDGLWKAPQDPKERNSALEQLMRRRRAHRISNMSKQDAAAMEISVERKLKAVLGNGTAVCSGIDWHLTAQEVVTFYGFNLADLLKLLNSEPERSWITVRDWLASVRAITHWFMMPFYEYPPERPYSDDTLEQTFSFESEQAQIALQRCRTQYSVEAYQLHEGEQLLSGTVEEILDGLCKTAFQVGLSVDLEWLLHFNKAPEDLDTYPQLDPSVFNKKTTWKRAVEELMAWLGWVEQWTSCEGPCAQNEVCYIPMWPVNFMMGDGRRRRGRKDGEKASREDLFRRDKGDGPPGNGIGWFGQGHLWDPVCVNASAYPPP
ncbi:hypothetical protein HDK90DRAFT_471669 [Phyllosticta capitalensis]|uniref:Uncharacterized protein n=1 Tax=Phyllosticta capitalensis TaxID=121624 RepID=A0ABR1Z1T7_9PEZI